MSFTVLRKKNGKYAPVTVSIFDAFRGAPSPTVAKQVPCRCCGKIHAQSASSSLSRPSRGDANISNSPCDKHNDAARHDDDSSQPRRTHDEALANQAAQIYSATDDAKIIEMKAANKSWKDIMAVINKGAMHQLKNHWRQIDPSRKGNEKRAAVDPQVGRTEQDDALQRAIEALARKEAELHERLEAMGKTEVKRNKHELRNSHRDARPETAKSVTPATHISPTSLRKFSDQYDRHYHTQKWIAAASKHFDLTGERITPEAARRMAEKQ